MAHLASVQLELFCLLFIKFTDGSVEHFILSSHSVAFGCMLKKKLIGDGVIKGNATNYLDCSLKLQSETKLKIQWQGSQ